MARRISTKTLQLWKSGVAIRRQETVFAVQRHMSEQEVEEDWYSKHKKWYGGGGAWTMGDLNDDLADVGISKEHAKTHFLLSDSDLQKIMPYSSMDNRFYDYKHSKEIYRKADIYAIVRRKWGSFLALEREKNRLALKSEWKLRQEEAKAARLFVERQLTRGGWLSDAVVYWWSKRKLRSERDFDTAVTAASHTAVWGAIISNSFVFCTKAVATVLTGSSSMMAEAVHSLADVGNQVLLAIGIQKAKALPSPEHPYGREPDRYVFGLLAASSTFFLGGVAMIYGGVDTLFQDHSIGSMAMGLSVLGAACVFEGISFGIAVNAVRTSAVQVNMPFWSFVSNGPDAMGVAVLVEDGAAVLGNLVAMGALSTAVITGNPMWDAVGMISVGSVMGFASLFLIEKNRDALVGRSIPPTQLTSLVQTLARDPVVSSVHDVKAVNLGADVIRFKAEITFNGTEIAQHFVHHSIPDIPSLQHSMKAQSPEVFERMLVEIGEGVILALGDEVDRVEGNIRKAVPEARHVDLEAH